MDCPKKWEEVGNTLMHLQNHFLTERVIRAMAAMMAEIQRDGFEIGVPYLYKLERQNRARVTLRAKNMFRDGCDVQVSGIEGLWLLIRAQCACDFLGQMFPPMAKEGPISDIPPNWDTDKTCSWMLTELWDRRSDSWLKLVALEWAGPFPFYGIEAAPEGI